MKSGKYMRTGKFMQRTKYLLSLTFIYIVWEL